MDDNRRPKQPLYSQLCLGMCNQGRPRLELKDVVKRNMKLWRETDLNRWQESAKDRPTWINYYPFIKWTVCTHDNDNDDEPIG